MKEYNEHSSELVPLNPRRRSRLPINTNGLPDTGGFRWDKRFAAILAGVSGFLMLVGVLLLVKPSPTPLPILGSAWSSRADPFSTANPEDLGILSISRPSNSMPGEILANLIDKDSQTGAPFTPLPTNSWFENLILGDVNNAPENKAFQIPYIIDTAGSIPGIRTHGLWLLANDRMVEMIYEEENGLELGAIEKFKPQHYVHRHQHGTPSTISKLAIELEWYAEGGASMRSPIVRGSPYTSMKYLETTPRIVAHRALSRIHPHKVEVDPVEANKEAKHLVCGQGEGVFSDEPVLVHRELKFVLDTSDITWLVFVSEPTTFECSETDDMFDLRATQPMRLGMVRVALANNCTTGQNPQFCEGNQPGYQEPYENLLRVHAEVYPTAKADVEFSFPIYSEEEEELSLLFHWQPATMGALAMTDSGDEEPYTPANAAYPGLETPPVELLMFALPHHQERLQPIVGSSNVVKHHGCHRNIHGTTCPAVGSSWSLLEHLHRTSFYAERAPRAEMLGAIHAALQKDIHFKPPANYMAGAGDTYFSGKILAKLARILLVAEEVGGVLTEDFDAAIDTLRDGVQVWFNSTAGSPFVYDRAWGGIVTCGCTYEWDGEKGYCSNTYPDCPALQDQGSNFGAGFYNDHHYHFGYHIYAAAVLAKFDAHWGRKHFEHVLLLIRDIVNPSDDDNYFPTWRHKDWYMGFSWASGIVTIGGKPYPNGRNQESASEAIAAYEAVAMYGDAMAKNLDGSPDADDQNKLQTCLRIRDMGRLLMATEIRSMRTYWHVQKPGTPNVARVYPDIYKPKAVGMIWSTLAQLQTWFGNEEWKSYGIQLMPITPATELRDGDSTWLNEMLPEFAKSCLSDENCWNSGWSVLIYTCLAGTGKWREAWKGLERIDPTFYEDAGGNGQSLSNALWYIATRPIMTHLPFDGTDTTADDDEWDPMNGPRTSAPSSPQL